MKLAALLLALTPLPSSAGIFGGLPGRPELPRLSARSQQPPSTDASAVPSAAPQEGSSGIGSKNDHAAAQFAAKMDGHPGMALQMEARRKAEAQMKRDLAIGLSWYCGGGGGKDRNETLCATTEPTYEEFAASSEAAQKQVLAHCCLTQDSPVHDSPLCQSYRGNLAASFRAQILDGWRRLGRFLVVELPIYRGAANWAWRVSSRLLGLRRRVAVVRLEGTVGVGGIDSASVDAVEAAFKSKPAAVILEVNSGGGSPVQSSIVHRRLAALKRKYKAIPLLVIVEDVCASGAYYLGCAADEILVDPSSVVGSIGVVRADFGFNKAMEKLGVERRTLTAGASKAGLDSFKAVDALELRQQTALMTQLHDEFIATVLHSRGARLNLPLAHALADAADANVHVDLESLVLGTAPPVGAAGGAAGVASDGTGNSFPATTTATAKDNAQGVPSSSSSSLVNTTATTKMTPPSVATTARKWPPWMRRPSPSPLPRSTGRAAAALQEAFHGKSSTTSGPISTTMGSIGHSSYNGVVASAPMSVSGGNGKAAIVNGQSSRHQVATGSAPATAAAAAAVGTAAASPTSMVVDVPQPTAKVAAQARKQRAKAAFGAPAKLDDAMVARGESHRGIFDGSVYGGRLAIEVGLADGFGHTVQVARDRYGQHVDLVRFVLFRRGPGLTRVFQTKYNHDGDGDVGLGNSGEPSQGFNGIMRHQLMPLLQFGLTAVGICQALRTSHALPSGGDLWSASQPFAALIASMSSLLFSPTDHGSEASTIFRPTSAASAGAMGAGNYEGAPAPASTTVFPLGSDFERVLAGFVVKQSTEQQQQSNPTGGGTGSLPTATFSVANLPSLTMP